MAEENIELVIDYMADPSYINLLKKHYVSLSNPMSSSGKATYRYAENPSMTSATLIYEPSFRNSSVEPQDKGLCKICESNFINVQLMPCGHKVFCNECVKLTKATCPICRKNVTRVVRYQ